MIQPDPYPKYLTVVANRMTPHRQAFEAMGFKFGKIEVMHAPDMDGFMLCAMFECVCGKFEYLKIVLSSFELMNDAEAMAMHYLDPAKILIKDIGSTSPKHLRDDGYSEEQIAEIQRKGREAMGIET